MHPGPLERVFPEHSLVNLVSSIGNWTINVIPKVKTAGRYEGSVVFNQFGGAELPVEMAFEVEPSYAESLNDVTSMKVALPSSLQELFSPESVEATADGTKWVRLTMKKEQAQNCVSEQTCWSAAFSTNDFHQGTSDIFGTNSLNRSIRIEVNSLDRSNKRIQGYLRDTWKGLYRKATQGSHHRFEEEVPRLPERGSGPLGALRRRAPQDEGGQGEAGDGQELSPKKNSIARPAMQMNSGAPRRTPRRRMTVPGTMRLSA